MAKRRGKGMSLGRRLAITFSSGLMTFLVAVVVIVLAAVWTYHSPGPAAVNGDSTTVILRPGAGLGEISSALEQAHVIRSGAMFAAAAQITRDARRLKAGEYEFPSKASLAQVLDKIFRGKVVRHMVTIPEGVTAEMAVDILMAHTELTGSAPVPPEGSVLPDTYDVRRGEDRGVVLDRMMAARDKLLDQLWAQREAGLPFKSPQDAVTMASIVEKETAKPAERPMVARVFINRLDKGMKLQTDPTVIYGITRGRPLGRPIRASELAAATPYNTYVIDGLPPTPIANPSREALAAVMSPPPGDWLYFVADGTGGSAFASTLEAHNANVVRWRQIEREREGQADADIPVEPAPPAAKTAAKSNHRKH
jgi:UPF0755 protein